MCSLILTAKLNDINPQGWVADALAHIIPITLRPASTSSFPGMEANAQ